MADAVGALAEFESVPFEHAATKLASTTDNSKSPPEMPPQAGLVALVSIGSLSSLLPGGFVSLDLAEVASIFVQFSLRLQKTTICDQVIDSNRQLAIF